MKLTERRRRICEFIAEFRDQHGYAPTIRQIGRGAGISSTSVVQYHILRLERSGLLKRDQGVSRSVRVNPKGMIALRRAQVTKMLPHGARRIAK